MIVMVSYSVRIQDADLERTGGFQETVWIATDPRMRLPFDSVYEGGLDALDAPRDPTGPWRELQREHVFKLPRHPAGPFEPVSVSAHVRILPSMRTLWDAKDFGWGVLPARYDIASTFQRVFKAITGGLGRLRRATSRK